MAWRTVEFSKQWKKTMEHFNHRIKNDWHYYVVLLRVMERAWSYIFCVYLVLTKSILLVYLLSRDRFYILSMKGYIIFPTPATNSPMKGLRSKRRNSPYIFFGQLYLYQRKLDYTAVITCSLTTSLLRGLSYKNSDQYQ